MLKNRLAFVVALALISACGPSQKPQPTGGPSGTAAVGNAGSGERAAAAAVAKLTAQANQNPMLAPWSGPYGGVPPWDRVKADLFPAVFELGLSLLLAEVDAIAENPQPPNFSNVIGALEDSGRHEGRAETLFGVLTGNLNTEDVQVVDREWSPKITAAYDKITFNDKLFARISAVYAGRETSGLTAEQKRLLERTYEQYVRAGAKLSP
jgi:peptidyl-dipeptidase Dcp